MTPHFFPSITTTRENWPQAFTQASQLGLSSVCLFPTCLGPSQRERFYSLLDQSIITHVPLLHIRSDMTLGEILYFKNKYSTRLFNIHSQIHGDYVLEHDLSGLKKNIFLENTLYPLSPEIKNYAGICLDTAHIENFRLKKHPLYHQFMADLRQNHVGVAHISAITAKPAVFSDPGSPDYVTHFFRHLSEFDYLQRYRRFLPSVCALELENSLAEQITVIKYLYQLP